MKQLKQTFQKNCDNSGLHTFNQVKREGDVCLYSRTDVKTDFLIGYELFVTHSIKAGTSMRGGGVETEDREAYPGKSAFGKSAWFLGGKDALTQANTQFETLVKGEKAVVIDTEGDDDTESVPVVRVVSESPIKMGLTLPDKPFTQKQLAAHNNISNYKEVYSDLQKMLSRGILKIVGEQDSPRGKKAKLFGRV